MDNKVMVGLFVLLALIIGAIVIVRRNPALLERFKINRDGTVEEPTPTPGGTPTGTTQTNGVDVLQGTELRACTVAEIQDCSGNDQAQVCGYDRPTEVDKGTTPRKLTYNNSCYYCQLYGEDGKLPMGDATYEALGYTEGACSQ